MLRQWMDFEDSNILNYSKILLKFAIVFKIFEYFCPFQSSTIITGQRNFLSFADGLHDRTPEIRNGFEHFFHEIRKLFFCDILQILRYQFLMAAKR